jgi:hypothetical protein
MPVKQDLIDHLRAWLTPERRALLNCTAIDRLAGRPAGTLSRFAAAQPHVTLRYVGPEDYYPYLKLLGYEPPK